MSPIFARAHKRALRFARRAPVPAATQLDHAARALSTAWSLGSRARGHAWTPGSHAPEHASAQDSEAANRVRYETNGAARAPGHVESHFLKANSPDGARAIWIKHTLLIPTEPSRPAVAEVWAIAFAEGGARKLAFKRSVPLAEASLEAVPFRIAVPFAELRQGEARGAVGPEAGAIRWQLQFQADGEPFLPFRYPGMYSGPFPRSKSLTPVPDTRMHGSVSAFGETWQLDGWRGAQGHNWGQSHAHAYAWLHSNVLSSEPGGAPLADSWVEALTGRVRLAGLVTPWLSVAGLCLEGRRYRFDGARAILSRRVEIAPNRYALTVEQAGARLELELTAQPAQFAGLRYEDPDGGSLTCLNSKLAHGTFTLSHEGRSRLLYSAQAALEVGTRAPEEAARQLA